MRENKDPVKLIADRFQNDAAGFTKTFTKIFFEQDGKPQTLFPKQVTFLNLIRPEEKIIMVVKIRQCLEKETMVYTNFGPKTIEQLHNEKYRGLVWTIDENGSPVYDKILDIWYTGKKEVYDVKLWSGEKIRATKNHKIKTNNGWKKIQELTRDDVVETFEGVFGNEDVSDEEAAMIGYFITDGSFTSSTPKFTNNNTLYIDEFERSVKKLFNVNTKRIPKNAGYDLMVYGTAGWGSNKPGEFAQYLMKMGLRGVTGGDRVLPQKFLNMDKKRTAIMLNRIFAGDGWFAGSRNKNSNKKPSNEVGLCSPSLEFLYQVSYLLSKFGIHCSIYEVFGGKKQINRFFKLRFSSIQYVEKFVEEIDIFGKELRFDLNKVHNPKKSKNRVMYVKKIEGIHDTYDLMTEKYRSFIANGIHTHNCGISTAIQARAVHRTFFGKVPEVLVTSAGMNQAQRVLKKIKSAFESMPEWMRPEFEKYTETQIKLPNGTTIYSLPANADTCRGFSGDVMMDEMGILNRRDGDALWEALFPCTVKGYQIIGVSTPKGKDCIFYDLVNPKFDPETGLKLEPYADRVEKIFWKDVPHVAAVIDDFRRGMHPKQFRQEFECEFVDDTEYSLFPYNFMIDNVVDARKEGVQLIDCSHLDMIDSEILSREQTRQELKEIYKKGIYLGWDIAISDDGSIAVIFGVTNEDVWELIGFKKFPKNTDITNQVRFVNKMSQFYCVKKLTFDATGGLGKATQSLLREQPCKNIIHPFIFTPASKTQEYSEMRGHMERGGFMIPKIDECIKEFTILGYNPITGRIGAVGSHRTAHDDWPSAFLCAFAGRKKTTVPAGFTLV